MPFLALYMLKEIISFEEHVSSRNLGMDLVSVVLRLNKMKCFYPLSKLFSVYEYNRPRS